MGLAGALIRRVLRGGSRLSIPVRLRNITSTTLYVPLPLIGAVLVYALVAFLVYKQYRLIFDISYHIVSLLFVYAMVGWVQRGGGEKVLARRA